MANSSSLTKKEAAQQQLQQQSQHAHDVETQEHHAKASASAGLNLNIFGALSGAFSSKSKKTTRQNADGSSEIVEDRHDQGMSSKLFLPSFLVSVFCSGGLGVCCQGVKVMVFGNSDDGRHGKEICFVMRAMKKESIDANVDCGVGMANAAARGQGTAYAQGSAEEHRLKAKERGVGQEAVQAKKVTGKVDHLGIEA
jgi:hypothetical protein